MLRAGFSLRFEKYSKALFTLKNERNYKTRKDLRLQEDRFRTGIGKNLPTARTDGQATEGTA